MGFLRMTVNEYGTPVSEHCCVDCGSIYTVCPAVSEDFGWDSCLAVECPSYDISRDIDRVWDGVQEFIGTEPLAKLTDYQASVEDGGVL